MRPQVQIAFLTGPVNPASAALSAEQNAFFSALRIELISGDATSRRHRGHPQPSLTSASATAGPTSRSTRAVEEIHWVDRDFPYPPKTAAWTATPLWRASLRNLRNFIQARWLTHSQSHQRGVTALLEKADTTVFLAGSCGLELLAGLNLAAPWRERFHVIAYGPVARSPLPALQLTTIRGRLDPLSWLFFPDADHHVPGGHLGTLAHAEFVTLCARIIRPILLTEAPPRLRHAAIL